MLKLIDQKYLRTKKMAVSNTQDLIVDGAELSHPITITRGKISRTYLVIAYPSQITRNTTNTHADGTTTPDPKTVKRCRWYTTGIIRFHVNPETGFIYEARPDLHELEITLECILDKSHKQQLANHAEELYGFKLTVDNFVICPFQTFLAQLTIDIDGIVKTFYGTLMNNKELHPMRIIFKIEDSDELSKITSKLARPHDNHIILSYDYSLSGTSTAHASLDVTAEEVSQINLEKQIFGTSKAGSMMVSRSFMDKVSAGISSKLCVVEKIGVGASSCGHDLIKQEIINAISDGGFKKLSIDDIKQLESNDMGVTDDLKANIINSVSGSQANSSTSDQHSLDKSSSANSSNILHANSGASNQSGSQSSNSSLSHRGNVDVGFKLISGKGGYNYDNKNASESAYDNSNSYDNKDHAHKTNKMSQLNENSGSNSNSNMASGEIHGQIRQVKNIDVAIVHRLNVAKGFKISLVRWHHQLSTACVKGRITTKGDTETLDEIQARQKAEGQANVNRQEYVPTTTHKPEIKKSTTSNVSEEIWELVGQFSSNRTPSELNLSSKKLSDNEIEVICDKLKTNQSLKKLDLSYNISDTSALLLSNALKTNRNLIRLNLSFNQISDEGVRSLSDALKENHCLTILNLSSNQIGDDGVQLLSNALKENQSLMELNLSSNRITDAGARSLSNALKVNRKLTILHLSTNQIGDDGALSLIDALKQNESLIKFYLSFNQIGDAGTRSLNDALKANRHLTEIDLSWNKISDTIEQNIQSQSNNNCKIIF
ncbi:unnamed protein product [Didymodactylos carnosus]|uniref:Uncharacterized protein n=2 Tax=Didymodactylos carnosus TaxID=1234261 RepID=A0A814JNB2_9BILA|nr:unnamed protein product [Didymodactylos carnosus]CAF3808578.1 unnamed protein product [Didymodactylos carnosus]